MGVNKYLFACYVIIIKRELLKSKIMSQLFLPFFILHISQLTQCKSMDVEFLALEGNVNLSSNNCFHWFFVCVGVDILFLAFYFKVETFVIFSVL